MVASIIGKDASEVQPIFGRGGAAAMEPAQRARLSLEVLAGTKPLTRLAQQAGVSRKFVYQQADKAWKALDQAFAPPEAEEEKVLFHLPVTKNWLRQFVLAQVLCGHTSFRGVVEIAQAVLDWDISVGSVHNIVKEALSAARAINDAQDLQAIRVGAHDEIYQARRPVLVGADVRSTYCYLLAAVDSCDQTAWGVHLLDLQRQGLAVDYTVADGGSALRAGQAEAWPHVPCHGDVFHAERDLESLAFFLERRATACLGARQELEHKSQRCTQRRRGRSLAGQVAAARRTEAAAVSLAQDVRLLSDWLQQDILCLAGPSLAHRRELFNFVVSELAAREHRCPHRIGPVRRSLEAHRDHLLAFAGVLEDEFNDLAAAWQVPAFVVQQICQLEGLHDRGSAYWRRHGRLIAQLGNKFEPLQEAVREILARTPRASSVIENLNSRLRNYFFLRREIGNGYLDLLRFFLNHRCFLRSECPDRVGKSPAQLLSGQSHPHWLELLGFRRFRLADSAVQN